MRSFGQRFIQQYDFWPAEELGFFQILNFVKASIKERTLSPNRLAKQKESLIFKHYRIALSKAKKFIRYMEADKNKLLYYHHMREKQKGKTCSNPHTYDCYIRVLERNSRSWNHWSQRCTRLYFYPPYQIYLSERQRPTRLIRLPRMKTLRIDASLCSRSKIKREPLLPFRVIRGRNQVGLTTISP